MIESVIQSIIQLMIQSINLSNQSFFNLFKGVFLYDETSTLMVFLYSIA